MELTARLRLETHALHTMVERSVFMAALLRGQLTQPAYCLLLRNLEPIYQALESGMVQHARHPDIAAVLFRPLFRQHALHEDLAVLHGPTWREALGVVPACTAYVARLHTLQDTHPSLLAAHAYVRYLGDLSGGQRLKIIVAKSLKLQDPPADGPGFDSPRGTRFYDFGEPAEVARLAQAFRAGLDALTGDGVVAEAMLAFEMHGRLFDDLALASGLPDNRLTASR